MPSHQERLNARLVECGLSESEYAVFCVLSVLSGQCTVDELPDQIRCIYNNNFGTVTREQCIEGLKACLAKGWVQVIDESSLLAIHAALQAGNVLRPINGMPDIGTVDFTVQGLSASGFFTPSHSQSYFDFAYGGVLHQQTSHYFPRREAALAFIQERQTDEWECVTAATGPFPIGLWRLQWWREFSEGFRVEIEERFTHRNRGSSGDYWSWKEPPNFRLHQQRLKQTLEQGGLEPGKWLVLRILDHAGCQRSPDRLPHWAEEVAEEWPGYTLDQSAWKRAVADCLAEGWVRILSENAEEQLRVPTGGSTAPLLWNDRMEHEPGDVDFTPAGAQLYQTIAREVLGSDWDAGLTLERNDYRAERRYAQTKQGIANQMQELCTGDQKILSCQISPIGKWCHRWWDQHPGGYLLEVEMGRQPVG